MEETAEALDVPSETELRDWEAAKRWLLQQLAPELKKWIVVRIQK